MIVNYSIYPLGDAALTIQFNGGISEKINDEVLARFEQLKKNPFPGFIEALPAYASLTVFYDPVAPMNNHIPVTTVYERIKDHITRILQTPAGIPATEKRLIRVPVCYAPVFAPDLETFAKFKNLAAEELIRLHYSGSYRVYMLGFLPGFPYMASVNEKIAAPRKKQPVLVEAGSVGIAGTQTGIYPFASPGGWQIIGRTPLRLFRTDQTDPALFRPGDHVTFYPISEKEFFESQQTDPWASLS